MSDASLLMDKMYRYQRYIYDFTRKPYLLGRDAMIAALGVPPGGSVLEIGCGTGRNLVKAGQSYPQAQLFGLDVSTQMLATARGTLARAGLGERATLCWADATAFEPAALFGRETFDRIFISYSLSMIPVWQKVLAEAAARLAPGGALHVVDFGTQADWPAVLRRGLRAWLAWFSVHPRDDLPEAVAGIAARQGLQARLTGYYQGYTVHAVLTRAAS